jgi:methylthioribose-1-phosphate isomerase
MPGAPLHLPVAVRWSADGGAAELLDQSLLPAAETYLRLERAAEMVEAIASLRVRGAPAIGVAAALGLALEAAAHVHEPRSAFAQALDAASRQLRAARPTAVNLAWAVDRMMRVADALAGDAPAVVAARLREEATAVMAEDRAMCRRLAAHGYGLLPATGPIRALTVCNAGALATSGMGTALAPLYRAVELGREVHVHACETRPLLQGSRITAWELARAGVACTIAIDAAAPLLLRAGVIDIVLAGADRVAANGDVANKVGTYSLAVHAARAGVPFVVVAPGSTLDAATASGDDIEIEHRGADEVRRGFGALTAPPAAHVFAPAFDVTPAALVTALVTDTGVLRAPFAAGIARAASRREQAAARP